MKKPAIVGFAVIIFLALGVWLTSSKSTIPDYPVRESLETSTEIVIDIPSGSSGSSIARILFEKKVVKSSEAFFRVAVGDRRSEKIAPGAHRLTKQIAATQALEQLLDPKRIPNLIRINEGAWKSEIVTELQKYGFSKVEIQAAFSSVKLPNEFSDSEGLLFPAQYTFAKGSTATDAVQAMVDRFLQEPVSARLLLGQDKFNPKQLLTIASIIQAEADETDFSKVSRVIRNRLSIGMPLQMDSTVHYIKRVRGQIFLSTKSTLLDSPYNTYKKYGLPPGPIGNPGKAAITASLEPVAGDWLYFITVAPGDTRFTKSIDEFNSWKSLYQKNRKAGMFK